MNKFELNELHDRIRNVLQNKEEILNSISTKTLDELIEDQRIYQNELEFQNDELRHIQSQLEISRQEFVDLFMKAPISYAIMNRDYEIVRSNLKFNAYFGNLSNDAERHEFRQLILPESQNDFYFFYQKLTENLEPGFVELNMQDISGKKICMRLEANTFEQNHEELFRLSLLDITETKHLHKALESSEAEKRAILDHLTDMVVMSNADGQIVYVSPSMHQFGFSEEDYYSSNLFDFVHPDDLLPVVEAFNRGITGVASDPVIFRTPLKSGGFVWVETVGSIITDQNGVVEKAVFVVRNIEERRKQEAELRELNQTKDRLFSIIAHDLRSPFNAFLNLTELLAEDADQYTADEIKNVAGTLFSSAKSVHNLINNLLEWSRLQRGVLKPQPTVNLVKDTIQSVIDALKDQAGQKKIQIDIQADEQFLARYDHHMLETVLRNLVGNAIKFTPRGKSIGLKLKQSDGHFEVEVADQGIGIPVELQPKIFNFSEEKNRQGTDGEKSSGLGLVICKEIIELQNGSIRLDHTDNQGSIFVVSLPTGL